MIRLESFIRINFRSAGVIKSKEIRDVDTTVVLKYIFSEYAWLFVSFYLSGSVVSKA